MAELTREMTLKAQLQKYLRTYPEWRFAPPRVQVDRILGKMGSDYGGYFVDDSLIGPESIVYSLGVGRDITFDLTLIRRFGLTIHAYDPTPGAKVWLASQSLPEQFVFHGVGIADFDGQAKFYLPSRPDLISHSIIHARQYSEESILAPMMRLGSVMNRLGHTRIDVLKMDIEGAEYGVLEDIARGKIPVGQILVEFHHRLSSIGRDKTRRALYLLADCGMKIAYVCPRAEIFTLVRPGEELKGSKE